VSVQTSAHGRAASGRWLGHAVAFDEAVALVAPGQTVALYDSADGDSVVGSATAA
jgi:tRNA U34 2-thiouridine synthase MnmA/TrmU